MKLNIYRNNVSVIAELDSLNTEICTELDALDLMAEAGQLGANKIIIRKSNICKEFFDLKTGIAGAILQKFSNYRMQLAIVGDFSEFKSKSLTHFIYESNRTGRIFFTDTINEAIRKLSKSA